MPANFQGATVTVGMASAGTVTDANSDLGADLYSLALSWVAPVDDADSYIVKRLLADGSYGYLGETAELSFVDDYLLVPNVSYEYQIISVKNGAYSDAALLTVVETRGVTGDNNRSGRVDGRDLENLARAYGSEFADEEYDALVDTSFDGLVDGSDLIDLGINFGMSY
jgi:hypothetical protein